MKTNELEKLIAQATPLPWRNNNHLSVIATVDESLVARIAGPRDDDPESLGNTKLIEYAVNNILRIQQENDKLKVYSTITRKTIQQLLEAGITEDVPVLEMVASLITQRDELVEALQHLVDIATEFYDMDCGENGSGAVTQASAILAKVKKGSK